MRGACYTRVRAHTYIQISVQIFLRVPRGDRIIRGTLHREDTARWENRTSTFNVVLQLEHRRWPFSHNRERTASGLGQKYGAPFVVQHSEIDRHSKFLH